MLITFSGLDGAGKSTLIGRLAGALDQGARPPVVRHMNYDVGCFPLAEALWRRVRGDTTGRISAGHPAARGARTPWARLRSAVVWNRPCRRVIYLLDLLIFTAYRWRVERLGHRTLIMDRYFYDTLVDIAPPHSWGWARCLARLTPRPDLAVLLDTSPEEAFARKGELSVPELTRRALDYRRVFSWIPTARIVKNTDLGRATAEILRLVAQSGRTEPGALPIRTPAPPQLRRG